MNSGVSMAGGSELRSMDRSVARRVSGLTRAAPGLESDGEVVADVGEVTMDMPDPEAEEWGKRGREEGGAGGDLDGVPSGSMRAAEGRAREEVMGELRTASRTGSKAGMASQEAAPATRVFLCF